MTGSRRFRVVRLVAIATTLMGVSTVVDAGADSADGSREVSKTEVEELALAGRGVAEATKIRDFIWASPGVSGAYLVTTSEGDVVINTGLPAEAKQHRALFATVSDAPIRAIVFTQSHVDHTGGTEFFREAGTRVLAQANYHDVTDYWHRFGPFYQSRSRRLWGSVLGNADQPYEPPPLPEPTEVFEDRLGFEIGGRSFVLLSTPGGETTDSLVVWLPAEKIVFTGNLFGPAFGNFPALYTLRGDKYRSAREFLRSLDRVASLGAELLITGHGDPIEGRGVIADGLARLRKAVQHVYDETTRGMNEGRNVYDLMRDIRLPPELGIGEAHGKVSWCVRAIWEEHAGWFHYDTTASLYPVPPSAVWREMAELAGGPGRLVDAARRHVAEGEVVEALHLLDVAEAAAPDSRDALAVRSRALEILIERAGGENFSEMQWLKSQLDEVRDRLVED